jgi:hypothetical protein
LFEALPDTPQSLGDIVGRSFRWFRKEMGPIFRIFIWPTLISTAALTFLIRFFRHWSFAQIFSLSGEVDINAYLLSAGLVLLLICVVAMAQWEISIRALALLRTALGMDSDYHAAVLIARQRKWATLLLYNLAVILPSALLLFWGAVVVTFLLLAQASPAWPYLSLIVFSFVGFVLTVSLSCCWLFTSIAFSVLAGENPTLKTLFPRTVELTLRYLWRGGSFVVLLVICQCILMLALELPMIVAYVVAHLCTPGSSVHQAAVETPVYLQVFGCAWDTVTNIIWLGVAVIANALYYHDLRIRMDGQDILASLANMSTG